jgi:serine/threonine-protein kinase GIN4
MISPNADLRCTAMQAIADPYWHTARLPSHSQFSCYLNLLPSELNLYSNLSERSSSHTSSLAFEKDLARLMNMSPPWKSKQNKEIATPPPGLNAANEISKDDLFGSKRPTLAKAKSQSKVAANKSKANIALDRILSN